MPERDKMLPFEQVVPPHLDAAYNLARWLMRNDHDAEDAVQDACVRALRFFSGFRGGNARVWLLTIVRNTCYSRLAGGRARATDTSFDEELHGSAEAATPETLLVQARDRRALQEALENLPAEYREVVVLRELEGLSYKEIADVAEVP
ncbi:MAG: sigma-70 family RNA polymerase sigma factor, partial [Candidatus Binataceae bacterium]